MNQRRLFISYSRKDQSFVEQLAADLVADGVEVWLDLKDILPGTNWGESIQEGLDSAEAMLLIVSPESMASENVSLEWEYYFDNKKQIIPILYKQAKIPFQISRLQYVDFANADYQKALGKLRNILGTTKPQPATPPQPKPEAQSQPIPAASPTSQSQTAMTAPKKLPGLPVIAGGILSVIVVVGIILAVVAHGSATPTPTPIPTDIVAATQAPTQAASTFSGRIAYILTKDSTTGNGDLYIMDADGSNQTPLAKASNLGGNGIEFYRWLDNQRIVFITSSATATFGLYMVNVNSQNPAPTALLTPSAIAGLASLSPDAVSPDGTQIILSQTDKCTLFDFGTQKATVLTGVPGLCSYPVWSPDSSSIAFYAPTSDTTSGLFLLPLDSSSAKLLADNVLDTYPSVWSPDARSLLYFTSANGKSAPVGDLNLLTIADGKSQKIAQSVYEARWSPDSKRLLYHKQTSDYKVNQIIEADLSKPNGNNTILSISEQYIPYSADWSPDGTNIVFSAYPWDQKNNRLYVTNADTFNPTPLPQQDSSVSYMSPKWQPG